MSVNEDQLMATPWILSQLTGFDYMMHPWYRNNVKTMSYLREKGNPGQYYGDKASDTYGMSSGGPALTIAIHHAFTHPNNFWMRWQNRTQDLTYLKDGKSNKGTAGGCVSCNFAGSRRFKVGSVRDFILGFRGVNGKGDIIKSGGTVVKNVTGYDLSKLVSGSFGTLVALTEVTLKISAKKPSQNTIIIYEKDPKIISDLFNMVLSSSNEISGAVFVPDEPKSKKFTPNKSKAFKLNDLDQEGAFFAFRIEGDQNSIKERIKDISNEMNLKKYKTSNLDIYQSDLFWKSINSLQLFSETKNNLLRAVVPPSKSEKMMSFLKNKYRYFIDWSGALFWIEVPGDQNIKEVKNTIIQNNGYVTIIKKSEDFEFTEKLFTIDDTKLMISKKIKESFDPRGLFNPGKMYKDF